MHTAENAQYSFIIIILLLLNTCYKKRKKSIQWHERGSRMFLNITCHKANR